MSARVFSAGIETSLSLLMDSLCQAAISLSVAAGAEELDAAISAACASNFSGAGGGGEIGTSAMDVNCGGGGFGTDAMDAAIAGVGLCKGFGAVALVMPCEEDGALAEPGASSSGGNVDVMPCE